MLFGSRKILGMAVEDNSILLAELHVSGRRREIRKVAEFLFPEGLSLEEAARIGRALREFMHQHHFSARHAVVGLPAGWLMVKEMKAPPADPGAIAGILRIQAERGFALDLNSVVLDFPPVNGSRKGQSVLLVAALRRKVEQLVAVARAAGLKVRSVTSSTMALAIVGTERQPALSIMVFLKPTGMELTVQQEGRFRLIRHLPMQAAVENTEWISDELRRVSSVFPYEKTSEPCAEMVVWDVVGLTPTVFKTLAEQLSMPVEVKRGVTDLGLAASASLSKPGWDRFMAAAAVGLAGHRPSLLPIDFLHSRAAPKKKKSIPRRYAAMAALGLVLVLAVFLAFGGMRRREREVENLKEGLADMRENVKTIKSHIENVASARGWYDRRPRTLDCLRDLTLAFPKEGRIWSTAITIREDMHTIVTGKSVNEQAVLEVLDQLRNSDSFSETKLLYMRQSDKRNREVSFSIRFVFVAGE